jgi:hypothetical protein
MAIRCAARAMAIPLVLPRILWQPPPKHWPTGPDFTREFSQDHLISRFVAALSLADDAPPHVIQTQPHAEGV